MIAYWIAFGPHGPRAEAPKGEGLKIAFKVAQLVTVSFALFYAIHLFAKPQPKTMSKEWQEASNEYALVSFGVFLKDPLGRMASTASDASSRPAMRLHVLTRNFFLQSEKMNPIHGISKEGYEGPGFVQSAPAEKS